MLGLASCNSPRMPAELENFQKNLQKSDSILENLAHFADSCTSKYDKNYAFFEKKAEIYYKKGANNSTKNNYVSSANDLFKALEAEKKSISLKGEAINDDFHFLGQIFESIGDIYKKVNSLKAASYFYDHSLRQFESASRQHEVIDVLLKIGDLYQSNHISNIALLNYETAEGRKNLTESQLDDILIRKGISLYDISDLNTADSIYGLISQFSLQNIEYKYFTACHFYNHNDYTKALPHLIYCFENGSNNMKFNAAEMLADVYFNIGDRNKELFYAQYQAKATSAEARLTPTRMELEVLYDNFVNETESNKQKDSIHFTAAAWIISILVLLLIGVSITYSISISNKKKHFNNNLTKDNVEAVEKNESTSDDKAKTINDISPKLEAPIRPSPVPRSYDDDFKCFSESKIFKEIKLTLEGKTIMTKTVGDYPRLALSKNKMVTLTMKFNECFPNLTHTLVGLHPELTANDVKHIILGVMGFSCLEIAVLLQLTYSSTNKRNKHIKDVLNTEEALEHFLPNYLRSITY